MTTEKNGVGRPKIEMSDKDFSILINMIRIQCTAQEICDVLGISEDTLGRRIAERGIEGASNFAELYKKHQSEGKASLRRAQWKLAESGNATMLIWLGKQVLGQSDKSEVFVQDEPISEFRLVTHDSHRDKTEQASD